MWNWSHKNWPEFSFNKEALEGLELEFAKNTGMFLGVLKHFKSEEKKDFLVDILSSEAIKTSEIEGEFLNRDSVQSSIKRNLGFSVDKRKVSPAEYGISEMMVDLYLHYNKRLTHEQLFIWHEMLTNGRRDLNDIGRYRTHEDPMQVVSGAMGREKVHFEAPPSQLMKAEMKKFIEWFNRSHSDSSRLERFPLIKAGITHLYFVCVHPFEDGNGRIGRALAEKSLAMSIEQPTFILLSHTIEANRKAYYKSLEKNNRDLEITDWLIYFGQTILDAQKFTLKKINFLIEKAKFFDRFSSQLNERQVKVVLRLFEAGHEGFKGGLSSNNYKTIAKTSASTATRDLSDLVEKNILIKKGVLKSTRYFLNIQVI